MSRVFGIDVIGAYYDAVVGRPFSVARKSVKPTCILSLYPEQSGRFKSVERLNELKTTPGYVSHGLRVAPGEPVGPAHEGHLPLMSIELQADTLDLLLERIHHIRSLGRILTVDTNSLEALRS
jgi:hypothetical protein